MASLKPLIEKGYLLFRWSAAVWIGRPAADRQFFQFIILHFGANVHCHFAVSYFMHKKKTLEIGRFPGFVESFLTLAELGRAAGGLQAVLLKAARSKTLEFPHHSHSPGNFNP